MNQRKQLTIWARFQFRSHDTNNILKNFQRYSFKNNLLKLFIFIDQQIAFHFDLWVLMLNKEKNTGEERERVREEQSTSCHWFTIEEGEEGREDFRKL